jgi:glycosyltransferase involved in cell wall biosynthesis
LVETIGGKAQLLQPEDQDAWMQAMKRITEDDEWWQSLRHGASKTAEPFTWDRCATDTLQVYRKVISPVQPCRLAS